LIRFARLLLTASLLAGIAPLASAQTAETPQTPLMRRLAYMDFGVSGMGLFSKDVSGTVPDNGSSNRGATVSESASNTAGALVNLRYTPKPYFGLEFNYTYARYTETFNVAPSQIQTGVDEASFGYVITPPHTVFGLQPFVSVGAGSTRFRPTAGGGEGANTQWRATYFYSVGLQKEFSDSHFGVRASVRQAFFKAPSFLANYLAIEQHTDTFEPNLGFYLRF
jgi:hypothetical protein